MSWNNKRNPEEANLIKSHFFLNLSKIEKGFHDSKMMRHHNFIFSIVDLFFKNHYIHKCIQAYQKKTFFLYKMKIKSPSTFKTSISLQSSSLTLSFLLFISCFCKQISKPKNSSKNFSLKVFEERNRKLCSFSHKLFLLPIISQCTRETGE